MQASFEPQFVEAVIVWGDGAEPEVGGPFLDVAAARKWVEERTDGMVGLPEAVEYRPSAQIGLL